MIEILHNPTYLLVTGGCVVVWIAVVVGLFFRQIAYHPRRPVPWHGVDVLAILMAYVLFPVLIWQAATAGISSRPPQEPDLAKPVRVDKTHFVERGLTGKNRSAVPVLVAAASALLTAPIAEELVFRLVLQGWFESLERRARRRLRWLRRIMAGVVPVAAVSLLFAAIHIRPGSPPEDLYTVVALLQVTAVSHLWLVAFAICWLKYATRAKLADFGIVPSRLLDDVRLGLLAFLAVTPAAYAIQFLAKGLLPADTVTDPIPLFFLAMALGGLYYRTHRIVPSVVLHLVFNAVGVLLALMSS